MVGFRNPENEDQERFNTHGSKARVIIECAFGKLKGQWRYNHRGHSGLGASACIPDEDFILVPNAVSSVTPLST